jgi:hypothetical protein
MYCGFGTLKDLASTCMFFCGWLSQGVAAFRVRQSSLRREYSSSHYTCSASRVHSNHSLWKEDSVTTDNVSSPAEQRISHVVNGPRDAGQFTKFPGSYWDITAAGGVHFKLYAFFFYKLLCGPWDLFRKLIFEVKCRFRNFVMRCGT